MTDFCYKTNANKRLRGMNFTLKKKDQEIEKLKVYKQAFELMTQNNNRSDAFKYHPSTRNMGHGFGYFPGPW